MRKLFLQLAGVWGAIVALIIGVVSVDFFVNHISDIYGEVIVLGGLSGLAGVCFSFWILASEIPRVKQFFLSRYRIIGEDTGLLAVLFVVYSVVTRGDFEKVFSSTYSYFTQVLQSGLTSGGTTVGVGIGLMLLLLLNALLASGFIMVLFQIFTSRPASRKAKKAIAFSTSFVLLWVSVEAFLVILEPGFTSGNLFPAFIVFLQAYVAVVILITAFVDLPESSWDGKTISPSTAVAYTALYVLVAGWGIVHSWPEYMIFQSVFVFVIIFSVIKKEVRGGESNPITA